MGKKRKWIAAALLLSTCMAFPAHAQTEEAPKTEQTVLEENERHLEQVKINMPEAALYCSGFTGEELEHAQAYVSQTKLEFQKSDVFSETGDSMCYYVMLDISGSIPDSYFYPVKDAILNLQKQLRPGDQLVLCAFGTEVTLPADGSQTPEELAAALDQLKNRDQETLLFEALDRVAGLAEQHAVQDNCRLAVMIVTDGEDFATGKKQSQEALNTLQDTGLPVYAFCIRDTAKENINSFGEFARNSGGSMRIFTPEEAGQMLVQQADSLMNDRKVSYLASSNLVTNQEETFSLTAEDGTTFSMKVMNNHWIPDTEAPQLLSVETAGPKQLHLVFSEPVTGADIAADYQLMDQEGNSFGISSVALSGDSGTQVDLYLDEQISSGTYQLICNNITDASMEKNPLADYPEEIELEVPENEMQLPEPKEPDRPYDYTGILFLILAAVIALIIVIVVIVSRKKKKEPEPEQETSPKGSDSQPASVELQKEPFHQHVAMGEAKLLPLQVWISKTGMKTTQTVWQLGSSLIVGRASICDIRIDDGKMSRQHFCLEAVNGEVYITDLNSTNGTSVNGIRIDRRRKLENGAVIEAGSMKFTVRW